jgi:hypothetical protein
MGALGLKANSMIATVVVGASLGMPSTANAEGGWGINGTYLATSNGDWAMTNERYHDETTVRSTWTISTTCTSPVDCTGEVISDQGWSAPLSTSSGVFYVRRTIKNWEPCPDGTAFDGRQVIQFYPVEQDTQGPPGATWAGVDATTGPSGACGINEWREVRMPFRLVKIA